jgi:hypothetical protein
MTHDPWADLSTYACATCRYYVPKDARLGRCRRHAPTMSGYPVVYPTDWCGDHKLGPNPSRPVGAVPPVATGLASEEET